MGTKVNILLGILTLIVLATSISVIFSNDMKISVTQTSTTFYVNNSIAWSIAGVEYNALYYPNGSLMKTANITLTQNSNKLTNESWIYRTAYYPNNRILVDTYYFNGNNKNKETFPISHTLTIYNSNGSRLLWEVKKLDYSGKSLKSITSPQSFGKSMKIEFQDGYSLASLTKSTSGGDLKVYYNVTNNIQNFKVRLFDPTPDISTLNYNLVSYYPFDDNKDQVGGFDMYNDAASPGDDRLLNYTISESFIGNSLSFTNVSAFVTRFTINSTCIITNCTTFSYNLWVYPKVLSANANRLMSRTNLNSLIQFQSANQNHFEINYNGNNYFTVSSMRWYMLTSITNQSMTDYYLNGTYFASTIRNTDNIGQKMYFGSYFNGQVPFSGVIDELAVWNRTLNVSEILNLNLMGRNGTALSYILPYGNNTLKTGNNYLELGSTFITNNLNLGVNNCLDFNHPLFGNNYTCSNVNITVPYFINNQFDNGSISKSSNNSRDISFYIMSNPLDEFLNFSLNITTNNNLSINNLSIYYNNSLIITYPIFQTSGNGIINTTNDSLSTQYFSWAGTLATNRFYISVPYPSNITNFSISISPSIGQTPFIIENPYSNAGLANGYTDQSINITIDMNLSNINLRNAIYNYADVIIGTSRGGSQIKNCGTLDSSSLGSICQLNNYSTNQNNVIWIRLTPSSGSTKVHLTSGNYMSLWINNVDNSNLGYSVPFILNGWTSRYPQNVSIETGIQSGNYSFNMTGIFNYTQKVDLTTNVQNYLPNCISPTCTIPVYITATDIGTITVNNISLNYSIINPNPIHLNITSATENFFIQSNTNNNFTIDGLRYDYLGGNQTYIVNVHNPDYTANTTYNVTYFYSKFNYNLPQYVDFLEFIPKSSISKNVSPYGQNLLTPFFNFTTYNYSGRNVDLSIMINSTNNCINISANTNQNNTNSLILNTDWQNILTNATYNQTKQVWLFADYSCSNNNWSLFQPEIYIRGCCTNCDICSTELI